MYTIGIDPGSKTYDFFGLSEGRPVLEATIDTESLVESPSLVATTVKKNGKPAEIDVMQLVEIVENSMSSATYGLLRRSDEAMLVGEAARHPRFVEDCIRWMMAGIYEAFRKLPDSVMVTFRRRNDESIHKHDIVAERSLTMGEIRLHMTGNSAGRSEETRIHRRML